MTTTKETTWRALVLQADPDHNRESRYVVEYEFPAKGPASTVSGATVHEGSKRVFRGNYDERGPYSD